MKPYRVKVERTRTFDITVEADSREEAVAKAVDRSVAEEPTWDGVRATVADEGPSSDWGYL